MATVPMTETAIVTLDANGNGIAATGPLTAREIWYPTGVAVSVATNTAEAECGIYVGDGVRPSTLRGATVSGSTGDAATLNEAVRMGFKIFAQWTGGDPGSVATLVITGTKDV